MATPLLTLLVCLTSLLLAPPRALAQAAGPVTGSAESWRDRIDLFVGLEGSKQPQDLGINANMGPRLAVNVGAPLVGTAGLGVQAGVAVNLSDAAVHVLDQVEGTSRRTQTFTSIALFQQTQRYRWALGYDVQHQQYYDEVWFAQWRGEATVAITGRDDIGVWFTAPARGSDATVGTTPLRLDPIGQVNAVARHTWASGATTGVWLGVARGHHNVVLVFPDNSRDRNVVVYGADLMMPLNERWAITGATNLITPTATGTVDAFMGVTVNLGRGPRRRARLAPGMSVANNTSFAVDLARR